MIVDSEGAGNIVDSADRQAPHGWRPSCGTGCGGEVSGGTEKKRGVLRVRWRKEQKWGGKWEPCIVSG